MTESPDLIGLLGCPRCDGALTAQETAYQCPACKVDFPVIDGLPYLFAVPAAAMGEWRGRVHHELRRLQAQATQVAQELKAAELLPQTRARLEQLHTAFTDQEQRLAALMSPLLQNATAAARETYLALRTRLPTDQGLNTYAANIFRDWAWGDAENQAAITLTGGMLPERPGRVLVLGAGAGRLARDLHASSDASLTLGLDFNPLLLAIARRASSGETLALHEFPLAPGDAESQAVLQQLQAPPCPRPGLHYLLGDVLRPPFQAGAFDVVVTPWITDILPVDFAEFAALVNRLLVMGGRWIHFGSLAFDHAEYARRYGLEECRAIAAAAGFDQLEHRDDEIPYLCSPASRHRRHERVVTWRADKSAAGDRPARHSALPEWLVTGKQPVPASDSFQLQAASTRIHAFVMGMIDGHRSIRDMAALMEQQRLMQAQEAEGVIREFLIRMYEDSRRAL